MKKPIKSSTERTDISIKDIVKQIEYIDARREIYVGSTATMAERVESVAKELIDKVVNQDQKKAYLFIKDDMPQGVAAAFADAIIRLASLSSLYSIDLDQAIRVMMTYYKEEAKKYPPSDLSWLKNNPFGSCNHT